MVFLSRVEQHAHSDLCPTTFTIEGHSHMKLRAGEMVIDEALGFHDFDKNAVILIVDAIGAVHDEPPCTTRSYVHLVNCGCKAIWPPPLGYMFLLNPGLPHKLSRCVKNTRCDDFAV